MDTKALRQKVLDLAIRGKLVPQDPNDEPASVLLERIRAEKAQMVKEGKLKPKDIKNDTIIYVGDDNLHYEKFQDGTVKCIEDEIPFDVPDGWEWERLGNISNIARGGSPRPIGEYITDSPDGINWIKIGDTEKDGKYICSTKEKIIKAGISRSRYVHSGDFLLTNSMSFGRPYILKTDGCIHDGWLVIGDIDHVFDQDYLYYGLSSDFMYQSLSQKAAGSTVKNLKSDSVKTVLFPIPPISEQKRIAVFSEQLISRSTSIANLKDELAKIVDKTKSKILNYAIQGKLVAQNYNDEPVTVLLERIKQEKEQQIREKKIKKNMPESVIFRGDDNSYYVNIDGEISNITDELPFEIPDTWAWGKLQDIFIVNPKNQLDDNLEVSFIPMPCINDGFSGTHTSETRKWKEIKKGFTHFREGDVVVAKITPCFENRKSAIMSGLINGYGAGTTELHVIRPYTNTILPEYILSVMKSNYFIDLGKQTFSGAVGQQRFSKEFFTGFYFPIPPIEEQKRIISQIRCLFSKLDMIEIALS